METNATQLQELQQRRQFFAATFPKIDCCLDQPKDEATKLNTCSACGYPTLEERAGYEICSICGWEDDGQDDATADEVWGGPNGNYSLTKWRLETADMLAALQAEGVDRDSGEQAAGVALKAMQAMINNYSSTDIDALREQISVLKSSFDKLRRGRLGRSVNRSQNG